jgi:ABC-type amino acid transport substrate-binding protein
MNRRAFLNTLTSGALAAPLAAGMVYPFAKSGEAPAQKETAYDHVMRTGKLRCGYFEFAPNLVKDPATGKMSGIFADLMDEIGRLQNLKIEWTEEAGMTNLLESLRDQRIDAVCCGPWPNALRAERAEFSQPVFYNALGVFARAGDTRFDNNLPALDDPSVRIAVIDGEMADQIAAVDFPRAQKVALPALSDFSQVLLTVATGKADVTIAATHEALEFEAHNPGTLREVVAKRPIRTFPNVLFFAKGEFMLASMLDAAIDEVYDNGHLDDIISKYEKYPHSFVRVQKTH